MAPFISYAIGAFLTLVVKAVRYVHEGKKLRLEWKKSLFDWFFADTASNKISWATTIGVVWMLGGYLTGMYGETLPFGPDDIIFELGFFFTCGTLAEMTAPAIAKKIGNFISSIKIGE